VVLVASAQVLTTLTAVAFWKSASVLLFDQLQHQH